VRLVATIKKSTEQTAAPEEVPTAEKKKVAPPLANVAAKKDEPVKPVTPENKEEQPTR